MQGLYLWHCSVRGRNPTLLPIQGRRVWFRSLSQVYMYVQHEPLDLFYFSKAAQGGPGLSSDARNERIPYFPSTTPRLNESTTRHEIEKPRRAAAKSCHPVSKSFSFHPPSSLSSSAVGLVWRFCCWYLLRYRRVCSSVAVKRRTGRIVTGYIR